MKWHWLLFGIACLPYSAANAARLSLAIGGMGSSAGLPADVLSLDIIWTMNVTDTATHDIDGFSYRFNVDYPALDHGSFFVAGVQLLPGWFDPATTGVGGPFTELDFFFGADDPSGVGISGNGTEFSTVIASIFLQAEGNVARTEITFRHNSPQDPIPAAYDGPQIWQLRWQYEVNGPLQFDIGVGNPGDTGGAWPYHGYETYQPLVIVPEPGPLAVLLLSALALLRFRR